MYFGAAPLPGATEHQSRSIEAAIRQLPAAYASWEDGIRRALTVELGAAPWSNIEVHRAILTVLGSMSLSTTNLTVRFLLRDDLQTFAGAGALTANVTVSTP